MRKNAFTQGNWYKGNTHTHTTVSDGTITQEEVVRIYKTRGYDFLALTEHNTYTDTTKYDTDSFITIPGAEPMLWHNSRKTAFTAHVVCIGIPGKLKFTDGQTLEYNTAMDTPDFIRYLKDNGNFTIFAHPTWSRTRLEHFNEYIEGADAIEIYNHECEVCCGQGFSETYFETALWGEKKVWAVAADDMHRVHSLTGGFVMCKAESLTKENIVNALISGNFYASTGAYIDDFYVEDGVAHVLCPEAKQICIYGDMYPGMAVTDPKGKLTQASWKYQSTDGRCQYVRCKVVTDEGVAFSQPIWLED